jgi:SSS family solute:Na+ symporter
VSDVLSALTLAYDLLVGGMLVPLMGAIFWKPATPAGAMISMFAGCTTAAAFMIRDGIDANSPIYYSLAASLVTFSVVSMLSQPNAYADSATDRSA